MYLLNIAITFGFGKSYLIDKNPELIETTM